jgi:hypothetical protein
MSNTSPKDQSALTSDHVASRCTRPAAAGVEVWRVTLNGRVISCELRDETKIGAGWDVCIRQDGELLFSRRCPDEAFARFVANAMKQDQLYAGWMAVHE